MSQFDEYMNAQRGELDTEALKNYAESVMSQVDALPSQAEVEQQEKPQGATPAGSNSQPQQAATAAPKPQEGQQEDQSMPWQEGYDVGDFARTTGEAILAVPTGAVDFGVDLVNQIPGVNVPKLNKFTDNGLQALREISSIILPTIALTVASKKGVGKVQAFTASKATKGSKLAQNLQKLENDKAFQLFANTGLAAGAGATVDSIVETQEKDANLQRSLRDLLNTDESHNLFGIFPPDWATLDTDHPDVIRAKNRNEGIGLGIFADILGPAARFLRGKRGVRQATKWVPEDELAKEWISKEDIDFDKVSGDDIEDAFLKQVAKRSDALDDLGEYNFTNNYDLDNPTPQLGVHDVYDAYESGIKSVDGSIMDASVQAVRIEKNLDSSYGRVGTVFTDPAYKYVTKDGENAFELLREQANTLKNSGEYGYKVDDSRYISFKEIDDIGEKMAADMYGMTPAQLKRYLDPLKGLDPDTKVRVINAEAYRGVMKLIRKYTEDYTNMNLQKAMSYIETSTAGQVSDMAEGMRMMDETAAVGRAQEQILDRLAYLMIQKGQRSYVSGRGLGVLNMAAKALKDKPGGNFFKEIAKANEEGVKDAFERIVRESNETLSSLQAVNKERPEMLKPLMLAYEMTDGKVRTMHSLNEWIRESSGTVSKAFVDGNPEVQSLVMQGVWANIYNSILSSLSTPIKAGASNLVLLVERPVATFAGALAAGDRKTLRRGLHMYFGMGETLRQAGSYMGQVFRRASQDPNSVAWLYKTDFQRKNDEALELYRTFAEGSAKRGDLGPQAMYQQIEALNDLSNHPVLKFGMNAMAAFDGFTNSFIANVEARGRAFDIVTENGTKALDQGLAEKARKLAYEQMFDTTGKLTDKAVQRASAEIAMNMDSDAASALSAGLRQAPFLKPFVMFPKTSMNIMRFTDTHSPFSVFVRDYNQIANPLKPTSAFTEQEIDQILKARDIPIDEHKYARFDTLRAEIRGRKAIGTLAMLAAGPMFLAGNLRGNGHFDKETDRVAKEANYKPRTYKGLDGNWYSYDNLGAISDWLAVTADVMGTFGSLDEADFEMQMNRMGFLLSAHMTSKSFMSGLEPLFDIMSGNPAAGQRWAASFGSGLVPLSGFRNEVARLMHPELRVVEQDIYHLIANRNPMAKDDLGIQYSWITGKKVNEPANLFHRFWNTYSPWKTYGGTTKAEQFLIDVEFDARPTMQTNGKGVDYTPKQRAELYRLMGEDAYFAGELERIMKNNTQFVQRYNTARASTSTRLDHRKWDSLHAQIRMALREAKERAELMLTDRDQIFAQYQMNEMKDIYQEQGDIEGLNNLMLKNK